MPWLVLKWYLTQKASPFALTHWKVCEPEAVDVAEAAGQAAVADQPGELMRHFRRVGEEVPDVVGLLHVAVGVALLRVDEVGEHQRVADEEDGRVVADQVVVASSV